MIVNKDGVTIGPSTFHIKDLTITWLKNKKLVITNDGELYNRGKDNSVNNAPLLEDNTESNSSNVTHTISQSGENVKTSTSDLAAQNLKAINLSEPQYPIFFLSSGTTMRNLSHWRKVE